MTTVFQVPASSSSPPPITLHVTLVYTILSYCVFSNLNVSMSSWLEAGEIYCMAGREHGQFHFPISQLVAVLLVLWKKVNTYSKQSVRGWVVAVVVVVVRLVWQGKQEQVDVIIADGYIIHNNCETILSSRTGSLVMVVVVVWCDGIACPS